MRKSAETFSCLADENNEYTTESVILISLSKVTLMPDLRNQWTAEHHALSVSLCLLPCRIHVHDRSCSQWAAVLLPWSLLLVTSFSRNQQM